MNNALWRRFRTIFVLLVALHVLGVAGYMLIEHWSFLDALYMTVITLGTIGYGETRPLDTSGRIFTMVFIFIGLGSFTYAISSLAAFWIEFGIFERWERRHMDKQIERLRDHIVVAGGGDSALHICRELIQTRTPYVVIEINPAREAMLRDFDPNILYLTGDASETEVLERAGVEHAAGVICCLPDDKDNLLTVLQVRDLNPNTRIVTRIRQENLRPKFEKAGASAVVSSQRIGALRLASEMLRPHVVSVLDVMLRQTGDVRVQEMEIGHGAAGKTISELALPERAGVTVFAMRQGGDQRIIFNPPSGHRLATGDVLIGCADPPQLLKARSIAASG